MRPAGRAGRARPAAGAGSRVSVFAVVTSSGRGADSRPVAAGELPLDVDPGRARREPAVDGERGPGVEAVEDGRAGSDRLGAERVPGEVRLRPAVAARREEEPVAPRAAQRVAAASRATACARSIESAVTRRVRADGRPARCAAGATAATRSGIPPCEHDPDGLAARLEHARGDRRARTGAAQDGPRPSLGTARSGPADDPRDTSPRVTAVAPATKPSSRHSIGSRTSSRRAGIGPWASSLATRATRTTGGRRRAGRRRPTHASTPPARTPTTRSKPMRSSCADGLLGRRLERLGQDQDERRPDRQHPADIRRERVTQLDRDRAPDVAGRRDLAWPPIDDVGPRGHGCADHRRCEGGRLRRGAQDRRAGTVDRRHGPVVGGVGTQPGQERLAERRLVGEAQQGVGEPFGVDGRGPPAVGRAGGAEAARSRGWARSRSRPAARPASSASGTAQRSARRCAPGRAGPSGPRCPPAGSRPSGSRWDRARRPGSRPRRGARAYGRASRVRPAEARRARPRRRRRPRDARTHTRPVPVRPPKPGAPRRIRGRPRDSRCGRGSRRTYRSRQPRRRRIGSSRQASRGGSTTTASPPTPSR